MHSLINKTVRVGGNEVGSCVAEEKGWEVASLDCDERGLVGERGVALLAEA